MRRRSRTTGKLPKTRSRKAKILKATRHSSSSVAGQETEVARFHRERDEALERETATSEVLRLISKSPGDLELVFQSILENATRLCEAQFGLLFRYDGRLFNTLAVRNAPAVLLEFIEQRGAFLPPAGTVLHDLLVTRDVVHRADASAAQVQSSPVRLAGAKSFLAVPMFKDEALLGIIIIYRQEVRPFTDKQIELVQNFAAQAVIAIENARLLNELRQRTTDLTESLEQQTGTAEVLKVISSSPGKLEPVFESLLANAKHLCGAKFGALFLREGDAFRTVAVHGSTPEYSEARRHAPLIQPAADTGLGRVLKTRQAVQIPDIHEVPGYLANPVQAPIVQLAGARTMLSVPMLKEEELLGVIEIFRTEVNPFTNKQIELVKNFAAQAVIAIENTRLLNELRESLDRQTATSEVLGVISSSPNELGPVFQTILANATRLCEANFGTLNLYKDGTFPVAAMHGVPAAYAEFRRLNPQFRVVDRHPLARVAATGQVQQILDMRLEPLYLEKDPSFIAMVERAGARTLFLVPMLKDNDVIGVITIFRQEVRPFTDKQIELVKNFAAQAVIAIENARLLNELRERTADLTESLEQQTATSEVLSVISSSPGELEP